MSAGLPTHLLLSVLVTLLVLDNGALAAASRHPLELLFLRAFSAFDEGLDARLGKLPRRHLVLE